MNRFTLLLTFFLVSVSGLFAQTAVFTSQPADTEVIDGQVASFTVVAEAYADGTPWTQFAWQVSSDGGDNWFDVFNATEATLNVTTQMSYNGNMYRAAATSGSGFSISWHEFSEAATLTVVEAPPAYPLTFHIADIDGNIEGATITIDGGDLTTDVDGNAMISLIDGDYAFSVVADGYDNTSGNVLVAGAAVTEEVVMTETIVYHMVTFHVSDADGNIEGATVNIEGNDLTTDADGIATIELTDGDYDYTVLADGYSDHSGSITVAGDDVTESIVIIVNGIDELNAANISIYPNPSRGVFFIELDREFTLSVIDVTGKVVYTTEINAKTEVDLTDQKSGIYIIKLINKGELLTYRVIVQ